MLSTHPTLRHILQLLTVYKHELFAAVISLLTSSALIIFGAISSASFSSDTLLRIWSQWDAHHYLNIAEYGYFPPHLDAATIDFMSRFPPLYPALLKVFAVPFAGDYIVSAVTLSVLLTCIASIYLYKLVQFEFKSNSTALWSVLFLNIFPTRYFLVAPYSESLFILLIVLYFYYMRVKSLHKIATIAYAAALTTRVFGVFMYPVHIYFCIAALRKSTNIRQVLKHIFLLVLPGVVLVLYQFFVTYVLASDGYLHSADASSIRLTVPFTELLSSYSKIIAYPEILFDEYFLYTTGFTAIFMFAVVVLTIVGFTRLPRCYSVYAASCILFIASLYWVISGPRFMLVCFPALMVLARIPRTLPKILISIIFIVALATFSQRYSTGQWAF